MTSYSQKTTRTVYYSHGGPGQNQVMETTVRSGGDGATTETHRTTYSSDEPGLFLDSNFGGLNINTSGFGPGRFTSSIAKPLNLRYSRGWSSKKDNSTRRGLAPMKLKGKTYAEIKQQCLAEGRLFEDPDFPAQNSSIFYSEMPARSFVWKRPPVSTFLVLILLIWHISNVIMVSTYQVFSLFPELSFFNYLIYLLNKLILYGEYDSILLGYELVILFLMSAWCLSCFS